MDARMPKARLALAGDGASILGMGMSAIDGAAIGAAIACLDIIEATSSSSSASPASSAPSLLCSSAKAVMVMRPPSAPPASSGSGARVLTCSATARS
jgi:hypothetical protein